MRRRLLLRGTIVVCLASLSIVLFGSQVPDTMAPAAATPPRAPEIQDLAKSVGASIDPNIYVIGAEDVLRIQVWQQPELSGAVLVRPDGMITLPLVDDLKAAGLTPKELQQQIRKALEEFVNKPMVTVSLADVRSKRYFVVGEVYAPGPYPLVVPTKVLHAIAIARGLREFADKKHIAIIRGGKLLKFNYKDVSQGKNLEQDVFLENGDIISIPD